MKKLYLIDWFVIMACIAIVGLVTLWANEMSKSSSLKAQLNVKEAELIQSKNKYGEAEAERIILSGSKDVIKAELESWKQNDSSLRAEVNNKTQQIVVLNQQIKSSAKGKTRVVIRDVPGDTAYIDTMRPAPTYKIAYSDKWKEINGYVNQDSFLVDLTVNDKVELITERKTPIFGPETVTIKAISKNPDSRTVELNSIVIQPKKAKRGKFFLWGVLSGAALSLFLSH